jgi:hypothetical protein
MRERTWLDDIVTTDLSFQQATRLLAVARAAEEYTRHGVQDARQYPFGRCGHPSWCQRSIAGLPCDCGLDKLREKLKGSSRLET